MNRITVSKSDCKQETTSAWLASILQFCLDGGFLAPFKAFKLNMKEVTYNEGGNIHNLPQITHRYGVHHDGLRIHQRY